MLIKTLQSICSPHNSHAILPLIIPVISCSCPIRLNIRKEPFPHQSYFSWCTVRLLITLQARITRQTVTEIPIMFHWNNLYFLLKGLVVLLVRYILAGSHCVVCWLWNSYAKHPPPQHTHRNIQQKNITLLLTSINKLSFQISNGIYAHFISESWWRFLTVCKLPT